MDVIADVGARVIVAALVHGNDAVVVTDAVDDQQSASAVSIAAIRSSNSNPRASSFWKWSMLELSAAPVRRLRQFTAWITPTASFPLTSAATNTGSITSTSTSTTASVWASSLMPSGDNHIWRGRTQLSPKLSAHTCV